MLHVEPKPVTHLKFEKICAWCMNYTFRDRDEYGQAYCAHYKTWFPDQQKWALEGREKSLPPGERTCKHWT